MKKTEQLKAALVAGGTILSTGLVMVAGHFCFAEVPVGYGGYRATHREDGTPKVNLGSALSARVQALRQYKDYGELCVPYRVGNGYYTGHDGNTNLLNWFMRVI